MDERAIKRLLITLGVAIVIIMVAKYMLTKAVTNVGKVAMEKKQAAVQQAPTPPADVPASELIGTNAASAVIDTGSAASAAEAAPH